MKIDEFVSIVAESTDYTPEEIRKMTKHDNTYPVGRKYEEEAAVALSKMARVNSLLDKNVECTPMTLMEYLGTYAGIMERVEMSEDELFVTWDLYDVLKNLYGKKLSDDKVLPSAVLDLGEGFFVMTYNRVLLKDDQIKPGDRVNDLMENIPTGVIFIDTTPGEPGMRTFYADMKKVRLP